MKETPILPSPKGEGDSGFRQNDDFFKEFLYNFYLNFCQNDGILRIDTTIDGVFEYRYNSRHAGGSQHPVVIIKPAMDRQPCVYMLSNRRYGTLYVGVTSDLPKRIWQHKNKLAEGFSHKYGLDRLVWYEQHETMITAIQREKSIKFWKRKWKLEAINKMNPAWKDLYEEIL